MTAIEPPAIVLDKITNYQGVVAIRSNTVLDAAWAKSNHGYQDDYLEQLKLMDHALDSVHAARLLWDSLSPAAQTRLSRACGLSPENTRSLLSFLAGVHDAGKLSPSFQKKVPTLWVAIESQGLASSPLDDDPRPHAFHSGLALIRWLTDHGAEFPLTPSVQEALSAVVAGHHGVYAHVHALRRAQRVLADSCSDDPWFTAQGELIDRIVEVTQAQDALRTLADAKLDNLAVSLLTGYVIQADWMASSTDHFPLTLGPVRERSSREQAAAESLNRRPAPTYRVDLSATPDEYVTSRFARDAPLTANPYQAAGWMLAAETERPSSLFLIEAPTGSGKTELALTMAEVLCARFGLEGLFFALPTQATADGILGRITAWLGRALPEDQAASFRLAHGKAQLNEAFTRLPRRPSAATYEEDHSRQPVFIDTGMAQRKLRLNSHVVVGTIDQLLFAGLDAKHVSLRHTGLVGKVVIIDEAHAASPFMRVYLCRALEWLAEMEVPVIIMTATLPPQARAELVSAYRKPPTPRASARLKREGLPVTSPAVGDGLPRYPRICRIDATEIAGDVAMHLPPPQDPVTLRLTVIEDDNATLAHRIVDLSAEGGCVGVICNTIKRSQDLYREIARLSSDVVLLHSLFTSGDRLRKEAELLTLLGPLTNPEVRRPERLIVVGTSVLEQSLDIDFDLLVTDLAPADLLIQRAGRLHRHPNRTRPAAFASPRLLIRGVEDDDGSPRLLQDAASIYPHEMLLQTLAAVTGGENWHEGSLSLPHEADDVVRRAYAEDPLAERTWVLNLDEVRARDARRHEGRVELARAAALCGPESTMTSGVMPEVGSREALMRRHAWTEQEAFDAARVRDTEESFEVILIKEVNGTFSSVRADSPLAGACLTEQSELTWPQARELAKDRIRLPQRVATGGFRSPDARDHHIGKVLDELEAQGVPFINRHKLLTGELILRMDSELTARVGDHILHYSPVLGLVAEPIERTSDV